MVLQVTRLSVAPAHVCAGLAIARLLCGETASTTAEGVVGMSCDGFSLPEERWAPPRG